MSKFKVHKRLSLSFLGEDWADCYIDVTPLSPAELSEILSAPNVATDTPDGAKENLRIQNKRLMDAFVAGKGFDGSVIELKAEDILDLPMEVSSKLRDVIMGTVSPN